MRKLIIILVLLPMMVLTAKAQNPEFPALPSEAQEYMPHESQSFTDGLMYIIGNAIKELTPDLSAGIKTAVFLLSAALATTYISSVNGSAKKSAELVCIIISGTVLLSSTNSLVHLGIETIQQLDGYSKLLLPIMTTALSSEGAVTKSAALYGGTAIFSSLLTGVLTKLFIPVIYVFIVLCIADRAFDAGVLSSLKTFLKWLMTWILKLVLYVFTGYITVTGIASGSTDAMALRATKITVSGMIPVVGGIISDASEAILVGAGLMKNTAGIYGIFAFLAICIRPILKISVHCILLKITAALCGVFGLKSQTGLVEDFSQAMSMALAATGSMCLLLLISTVAFMKGVQ